MAELMWCPFCGEYGFDLIGLKMHYDRGWCEAVILNPLSAPAPQQSSGVETINAAPQAHVNAGDGIDAPTQAGSKPAVAAPEQQNTAEIVELFLREARLMPSLPIGESFEEREQWTDWITMVLKNCGAYQVATPQRDLPVPPELQMAAGGHTTGIFKDGKLIAADADVYQPPEQQELIARLKNIEAGWTPGAGECFPITLLPNEREQIIDALSRSHEDGRRAAIEECEKYLHENALGCKCGLRHQQLKTPKGTS